MILCPEFYNNNKWTRSPIYCRNNNAKYIYIYVLLYRIYITLLTLRIQLQQVGVLNANTIVIIEIDLNAIDAILEAKNGNTSFNQIEFVKSLKKKWFLIT